MAVTITRNPNLSKSAHVLRVEHEIKKQFQDNWWTGLAPDKCPGFDEERNALVALPLLNLKMCSREDILAYFNNSWTLTELLFYSLKREETYTRPPYHGLRHPMIFYYGHPAVLYLNKMRLAGLVKDPVNLYLEKVLETGVDEMSWDDMSKNEMKWPSVAEVRDYRQSVYNIIVDLIQNHPELETLNKIDQNSPWWSLWMGMEHEKIHFETSSVLIRELPIEFVETPKFWVPLHPSKNTPNETVTNTWKKQAGEIVKIGKPNDVESYGWDNEYGSRTVKTKDFEFTKFQITNGEYLDFVASGSYVNDKYWSAEGLLWRKFRNTKRPTFWVGVGPEGSHQYELRTLFEIIPLPLSWPVEVNFHEAQAYCNWKNEVDKSNLKYRLLTEAEFVSLTPKVKDPVLQKKHFSNYKRYSDYQEAYGENFNFVWSSAREVGEELYGNVWHWLLDQFNPLEHFKVNPLYDDFSTPCFDGKHQMIRGGSFISCGHEASHWARFHFRPHFYQHSGFRMARTLDGSNDNGAKFLDRAAEYIHPKRLNVLDQMNGSNDWWKNVEQPLELSSDEVSNLLDEAKKSIVKFQTDFERMHPMGLAHDPLTNTLKKNFALPFQEQKNFPANPENFKTLLNIVTEELAPYSQHPGHPGFAAYVAGGGNFISNVAQMISQTLNEFSGHYMMAPGAVAIEMEVIRWFMNMVGFDESKASGYLTTGSSLATQQALAIARKEKIKGYDYSYVTGYVSADTHHCVAKAWSILGLNPSNLRRVDLLNHKMDTVKLKKMIKVDKENGMNPFFVVTNLGTTKTGAIDDSKAIAQIAKEENLWLHGDGAYGAFFMLTEKGKHLLSGIELCDSLALDPHKSLSLPYGTGCLLVADKSKMYFNYDSDNSYMPPIENYEVDFSDISPELSREARGLRVWLPIKTLGIAPFALNLEEKLKLSEYAQKEILKNSKLEILSSGDLSIFTFRHKDGDEKTRDLLVKINNKGTLFLSSCVIDKKFAIRMCFLGFRFHYDRLDKALKEINEMI